MTVYLVGAGPGDPDLLTVKSAALLARADVVVHDRLVDARVLALLPPWAEVIDVGKVPGSRANSQHQINEILIDRGGRFGCVVRLKGGDPFVFGRGGEEALALHRAGVAVELIPGISSAIAAPAVAGVPVTMRGVSSGFTVVTARETAELDPSLNWASLATAGTTLVILMGAAQATVIADRLISNGMSSDTPVAIITAATTPAQRVVRTVLGSVGGYVIVNPSTIVVGAVAAYDLLDPFSADPTITQSVIDAVQACAGASQ